MYRDTVKVAAILNIGKEDFMKYLSRNQAEQWLNQHTLYGQKKKVFTNKFMRTLKNSYRLVPDKDSIFGKKYSMRELKEYANDVNPRQVASAKRAPLQFDAFCSSLM